MNKKIEDKFKAYLKSIADTLKKRSGQNVKIEAVHFVNPDTLKLFKFEKGA